MKTIAKAQFPPHPPTTQTFQNSGRERDRLFLDSIVENIPNMIFVKDAKELRFVRLNKAGEELLGFSREELIGKNDYDFFPKEEADFFTGKDHEALSKGTLTDIPEEPIHTRYKGTRYLHTKKIPILDSKGNPLYLLGISEDITEKKRIEREVLKAIGRVQRRIGQDLHDGLGQDLTAIAIMSKVLEKQLSKNLPGEAKQLKEISKLVKKSINKTRKLARGLHPVELEESGLVSALRELANTTQSLYHISCEFQGDEDITMKDIERANHVYRIAQEAVHNAVKHANPDHVYVRLLKNGPDVELQVKDDGLGLSQNGHTPKKGMGLHIMEYRARVINGTIFINSRKNKGTTVHVFFKAK